jgi:hypothetical protein
MTLCIVGSTEGLLFTLSLALTIWYWIISISRSLSNEIGKQEGHERSLLCLKILDKNFGFEFGFELVSDCGISTMRRYLNASSKLTVPMADTYGVK